MAKVSLLEYLILSRTMNDTSDTSFPLPSDVNHVPQWVQKCAQVKDAMIEATPMFIIATQHPHWQSRAHVKSMRGFTLLKFKYFGGR